MKYWMNVFKNNKIEIFYGKGVNKIDLYKKIHFYYKIRLKLCHKTYSRVLF